MIIHPTDPIERGLAPILPSIPRPPTASRSFWLSSGFILKFSYLWDKTIIIFRDILHKLKIFFCDDDVEKIYVRDSTVIRNNEIHRMAKTFGCVRIVLNACVDSFNSYDKETNPNPKFPTKSDLVIKNLG